jgi:hypothetical protein
MKPFRPTFTDRTYVCMQYCQIEVWYVFKIL